MAITSNRNKYLSLHTTPDVVAAVQTEVGRRNLPRSRVLHELLVTALRALGHDVRGHEYKVK